MSVNHVYVFFGKVFIGSSAHVFIGLLFWILSYISCLCILDINYLLIISFANIFYNFKGWRFILLMVSFAVEKLLSLIRSHILIFAFISLVLKDKSKIYCFGLRQRIFCLFSSRGFYGFSSYNWVFNTLWVYFFI